MLLGENGKDNLIALHRSSKETSASYFSGNNPGSDRGVSGQENMDRIQDVLELPRSKTLSNLEMPATPSNCL